MLPRHAIAILVTAATLAAAPAAGAALVVPGRSIGAVKLRQTEATVRRELGRPTTVTGQVFPGIDWHYASRKLDVWFGNTDNATGRKSKIPYVYELFSRNHADHTDKGIHIGSRMSAVRRAYPSLRCDRMTNGPCYLARSKNLDVFNYTFFDQYAGPVVQFFVIGTDTCCYGASARAASASRR